MNFNYTLSCLHLSAFQSSLSKSIGFLKLTLHHHDHQGYIILSIPFSELTLSFLHNHCGIYFYTCINPYIILFLFFKSDSFYYNYCINNSTRIQDNSSNPFAIRSFQFTSNIESYETSIMLQHPLFIHITGKDEELFIFSYINRCDYCHHTKECLHFNNSAHFCKNCITFFLLRFL
jgi:hypothetical protein